MRRLFLWGLLLLSVSLQAKTIPFGKGQLTFKTVAPNAVRIQYTQGGQTVTTPVDKSYIPVFVQSLTQPCQQLQ